MFIATYLFWIYIWRINSLFQKQLIRRTHPAFYDYMYRSADVTFTVGGYSPIQAMRSSDPKILIRSLWRLLFLKVRSKHWRVSIWTEQHTKRWTMPTPRGDFSEPSIKLTGGLELCPVLTLGYPDDSRPLGSLRDNSAIKERVVQQIEVDTIQTQLWRSPF